MPRCSSIICCGPAASGKLSDARPTAAGIRNDSGSFGADPFGRPKLARWRAAAETPTGSGNLPKGAPETTKPRLVDGAHCLMRMVALQGFEPRTCGL